MIRVITTILITLLAFPAFALECEWINFYSRTWTSISEFRDVVERENGNLIYFGAASDTLWIVHADSNGVFIRENIYINLPCFPDDATTLLDSSVAIVAADWLTMREGYTLVYCPETDSMHAHHWEGIRPFSITATPDSGFATAGFVNIPIDSVCIQKFEYETWDLQWDTCFYMPSYAPRGICSDPDGSLNIVANSSLTSGYKYIRSSPDGETIAIHDISTVFGAFAIEEAYNGGYLIAGEGVRCSKIDSSAAVLWVAEFPWSWIVFDIVKLPGYRYGLNGTQLSGSLYNFIYAILDSSGNVLDTIMLCSSDTSYQLFHSIACRNGDVLVAGRVIEGVAGRLGCGIRIESDTVSAITESCQKPDEISIYTYPNPFNSSVSITPPANALVEIFDIEGRKISVLNGGEQLWRPKASVGSGIYLVRATVGDEDITKRVVYLK
ncbi:MAG: T9SS type A sorting domain-containing protein [bacterium]